MKIDVRNDTMGEHYARAFEHKIGDISRLLFKTDKAIIIYLDKTMGYIKHEINDPPPPIIPNEQPPEVPKKRHYGLKYENRADMLKNPKTQKILDMAKMGKYKRYHIETAVGVSYDFLNRVIKLFDLVSKPHKPIKIK